MTAADGPGTVPAGCRAAVAVVLGTRPGIVKLAPVLHALAAAQVPHFAIHSGQHYSANMDQVFFTDLDLPAPAYRVGDRRPGMLQGEQTAEMLAGIERVLARERPALVLVGGDANTNLAGALAARKLGLVVGHVEAGLRSRDWRMPEEHNRVMIDHISDILFAPSRHAKRTAEAEGVRGRVLVTGSTVGAALRSSLARGDAADRAADPRQADHSGQANCSGQAHGDLPARDPAGYALVTLHRAENVDDPVVLAELCAGVCSLPGKLGLPLTWPLHPRTRARLTEFGLLGDVAGAAGVTLIEPAGHRAFTRLLADAALVVTDSGGIQQEACILRVPCVTARTSTEWTETVEAGANLVAGVTAAGLIDACLTMIAAPHDWDDPFESDGVPAAQRIAAVAAEVLGAAG
ncbi:MAG: UDP-N-acetylglucosamine 2-epimerase (non-hydrolyzing) [Actinomycetota bacterium]|nr:UDP-N-acetylglucosamine 2-epimerase (non-hydrolyzing) [Actinomycetota bacterium]